ncbi:MAG: ABC transporter permease [Candidatus Marinimicrobia bacterium]|nr:ABC transporter permease [Candidatus Neomarinimicrobiota bacterium]
MNIVRVFQSLGPVDARSVLRDSLLQWMLVIPFLPALIVRWGIPTLNEWLKLEHGFDLTPYYTLIISFFLLFIPMLVGVVIGFLLLDERDDRTLTALRVTPLKPADYLFYRITAPWVISVFITLICFPIAGLVRVDFIPLLLCALMASLEAPLFALLLVAFARNKVVGLAMYKGFGIFFLAPLAVFFVDSNWDIVAGIFPTYWPVLAFYQNLSANPRWLISLLTGFAVHGIYLSILLKRFQRIQLD